MGKPAGFINSALYLNRLHPGDKLEHIMLDGFTKSLVMTCLVALVVKRLATPISVSDRLINDLRKPSAWNPGHGNRPRFL
jgi:hypothetical protein